jgi:hypothetical protein
MRRRGGACRRPLGASSQPALPVTVSSITLFYRVTPTLQSVVWVQSAVKGGPPQRVVPQSRPAAGSPSARARASSTRVSDRRPTQRPGQASREQWPSLITSSRSSTSYSPVAYCTLQHRTMGRGTAGQGTAGQGTAVSGYAQGATTARRRARACRRAYSQRTARPADCQAELHITCACRLLTLPCECPRGSD